MLALVAIPLAPLLYREEQVPLLVLLRPTKEVLLLAGFAVRRGDASLPWVVLAAVPLLVGSVWLMFALGRAYAGKLDDLDGDSLAGRVLPPKRVKAMVDTVCEQGSRVVFLGRLAAFPSTIVGAAAGASEMPTKQFAVADLAGAATSLCVMLGAGYLLGEAYDEAGPWLTALGVVVLTAGLVLLGRTVRKKEKKQKRSGRTRRKR